MLVTGQGARHVAPMISERLRQGFDASILLVIGLVGALLGQVVGLPMPFLLGALASVAVFTVARERASARNIQFPELTRRLFVGAIGVMIGAQFSPALLASLPQIWPSVLGVGVYVVTTLGLGTFMFSRLGGMDRVTAFYAAMPGGLVDSVTMGQAAGGDARQLALQHFVRIVLVVTAVPLLYLYWSGQVVGSAGGQSFDGGGGTWADPPEVLGLAVLGIWIGPFLRLPAPHLVGPLVLSAALHGSGILHVASPGWLLALAQLVVGTGLGTSFAGTRAGDLLRAFVLGAVYVTGGLLLAYLGAAGLSRLVPFGFDTLFVSFAPGGVTEMGLVALSLGLSPVVVTVHHLCRIGLTVVLASLAVPRFTNARQKRGS